MRKATVFSIAIFLVVCGLCNAALAQKATVLRVVTIKTDNVPAYVAEIEKGKQLQKSMGLSGHDTCLAGAIRRAGSWNRGGEH